MKSPQLRWSRLLIVCAVVTLPGWPQTGFAESVVFDTTPYWAPSQNILSGVGPGQSSTFAETFVAPSGAIVSLNDFSFYAESYYPYGGVAHLQLRAFVFAWSGSMTGHGGGAVGSPLYLSPSFSFSPPAGPSGWVPLTANPGPSGLALNPGGHYVMGFTLSNPADYAASQGDIEFQEVAARGPYDPPLPPGVDGHGGAVWLNNANNFTLLNTVTWDTWGDIGDLAFKAHLTVVPEPSTTLLITALGVYSLRRRSRAKRSG